MDENFCTGQLVEWVPGSIWETYAYGQHKDGEGVNWTPVGFDGDGWIRLRSNDCAIILLEPQEINVQACMQCQGLLNSPKLLRFMEHAKGPALPHTAYKYLTLLQMCQALYEARKQIEKFRMQVSFYSTFLVYRVILLIDFFNR